MASLAPAASRTRSSSALRGQRADVQGRLFAAALLLTLLLSLAGSCSSCSPLRSVSEAWPVLADRGPGFPNANSSSFADRAGVWQGLVGSLR